MQLKKTYPKYKDCEIQWIEKIPKEWKVHKLKFTLLDIKNSIKAGPFGSQLTINEMYNGEIKVYNQKNVIGKSESTGENYVSEEKFKKLIGFKVKKGDLLISTRGTIGKTLRLSEKAQIGILHPCLMKINNNNKIVSDKYIEIFIEESNIALTQLRLLSNATTIDVIYQDNLKEIHLILPPLCEQEKIVEYIDKAIAEIDILIEKDKKLIQLLKEKRIALINHAVTKGLDPNAKMKDSGIEWIGEIPEGWEVRKVKHKYHVIDGDRGKEYPSEDDLKDSGIPFLSAECIDDFILFIDKSNYISEEKFHKLGRGKLKNNDIILTVRGTIGKAAVFQVNSYNTGFINAEMMILRKYNNLEYEYLFYIIFCDVWQKQVDYYSYGTAQKQLNNFILKNILIPIPSINEQNKIVQFLDKSTAKINKTIKLIEQKIALLEEYKKSLIHHVVTGKIDVREAV